MDAETFLASLKAAVPAAGLERAASIDVHTTIVVSREDLLEVAAVLRDPRHFGFDFLADLIAVDMFPREPRFELTYLLVSIEHAQRLRIKVRLPGGDPRMTTVCQIWSAANWLEREVWDLFGIAFDGHPDPRRLLMPEDWEGFPLRKDYPVQIHLKPRSSEPLQVTEEEFKENVERDRLVRR